MTQPKLQSQPEKIAPETAAPQTAASEKGDTLHQLSHGELGLLQDITLSQMQSAQGATATLLFGRVWQRLEVERQRRKTEIRELEKMYFGR